MAHDAATDRLSLGSMLGAALRFARRRWIELLALLVCLDWAPHVILTLSGVGQYAYGSKDEAAFAASAVQSAVLAVCGMLMQASVIAVGIGGSGERVSGPMAITQVLQRLPTLVPWWLMICIPTIVTVWLRWSVGSPAEMQATYYWREFGGTVYDIALSSVLGLFSVVVLAENLRGLAAIGRTLRLVAARRGAVFLVAFATDAVGLIINLSTPYLRAFARNLGAGEVGYYGAYFTTSFLWEAAAVVGNLILVQLYLELARARDGVAPGELAHIFA